MGIRIERDDRCRQETHVPSHRECPRPRTTPAAPSSEYSIPAVSLRIVVIICAAFDEYILVEKLTVLENITNDAEFVEIASPTFGAERLLEGNLHVADRIFVPSGHHRDICKPEDKQVLHHLFAEIMVDAERLVLRPVLLERREQLAARLRVFPERLLDDDPVHARRIAVLSEVLRDGDEHRRREREVEHAVARLALVFALDLLEVLGQVLECLRVLI